MILGGPTCPFLPKSVLPPLSKHPFVSLMNIFEIFLNTTFQTSHSQNALAKWLSWLEYHPVHKKVASSISSQGCGFSQGMHGGNQSVFLTLMFLYSSPCPFSLLPFLLFSLKILMKAYFKRKLLRVWMRDDIYLPA